MGRGFVTLLLLIDLKDPGFEQRGGLICQKTQHISSLIPRRNWSVLNCMRRVISVELASSPEDIPQYPEPLKNRPPGQHRAA